VRLVTVKRRTKTFVLRIIGLYRALPRTDEARILGTQLLRSSTSIGANYRAACRGRSRAEFVAKLGIVLEEADETLFWLELIQVVGVFPQSRLRAVVKEANEWFRSSLARCGPRRVYLCNLTSDLCNSD
jgi:four helix bundle protein